MAGMPMGFADLLAQKYRIMQQQADADTLRANNDTRRADAGMITANSGANLDNARAYGLGRLTDANVLQTQAQTDAIREQNKFIAPLAQSQLGLQRSQARQNISQAGYLDSETSGNSILNSIGAPNFLALLQKLQEHSAGGGL
jgi:hypothetical protein